MTRRTRCVLVWVAWLCALSGTANAWHGHGVMTRAAGADPDGCAARRRQCDIAYTRMFVPSRMASSDA